MTEPAGDLLAVGLGNPGRRYGGSRHNYGAEAVRLVASRRRERLSSEKRLRADVAMAHDGGRTLVLAVPHTYMNDSGEAVRVLWRRFLGSGAGGNQLVIVHDELDLPPGTVRIKAGGGTAGHNGLKSIESHLHRRDFARVRIGVGKPPSSAEGVDHVLRRPRKHDREMLGLATELAADAVEAIFDDGLAVAMNRFNTRART